jgi:rhamnulokinase
MGNALCQARALGILSENDQVRQVLHNSVELRTYEPQEQALWKEKRDKYRSLRKSAEA